MLMVLLVSPWPDHACIHIIYKQTCLNHEIFCIYSFYQVTLMFSATMFLEFWKRRQFELNYEWDLVDYDEDRDLVRPEYAAAVPREKLNPVTMKMEPYLSTRDRYSRLAVSSVTVLFSVRNILYNT